MILIAIGANLPAEGYADPQATCEAAVQALDSSPDIRVVARSPWYASEPVPPSDQPWYINGVVSIATDLEPEPLLQALHAVEASFGRHRRVVNEARPLDLDLIDYDGRLRSGTPAPALPHPRAHDRAFVLLPLQDVAADWVHPVNGRSVAALIADLPPGGGEIRRISPDAGA